MLVTIDSAGYKTTDAECLRLEDTSFDPFYFEDVLRALASAEKIAYLGLQREFRKDWETNRRELHWGHWNYEGHKLVAALMAGKIARMLELRHTPELPPI